jgi:hypothetical protein
MKFFLVLFLFLFTSHAYAQEFIVIVNRGGPLAEANMELVKEVYLGEKRFAGDAKLLPINFTEGPLKDIFLKSVVGMNSKQYKHHWIKKVFQEGLSIPMSMGSPVDIIEFVSKETGAVAYLPAGWADTIRPATARNESSRLEEIKIIGP